MGLNTFFSKLVPKDKKIFPVFEDLARLNTEAAGLLNEIFSQEDTSREKELIKSIKKLEQNSDKLSQELFDFLDQTFVTPFDREDIHQLTESLDHLLDMMKSVTQKILMYRPAKFPPECKEFTNIIVKGSEHLQSAVSELRTLKRSDQILKSIKKISKIESESDDLYHSAISFIFINEKDAIELIKQKEIVEALEQIADGIQEVSEVLKTIVLKNA